MQLFVFLIPRDTKIRYPNPKPFFLDKINTLGLYLFVFSSVVLYASAAKNKETFSCSDKMQKLPKQRSRAGGGEAFRKSDSPFNIGMMAIMHPGSPC